MDEKELRRLIGGNARMEPRPDFRRKCLEAISEAEDARQRRMITVPAGGFALAAAAGLAMTLVPALQISSLAQSRPEARAVLSAAAARATPGGKQHSVFSLRNCMDMLEECSVCARGECAHFKCRQDNIKTGGASK